MMIQLNHLELAYLCYLESQKAEKPSTKLLLIGTSVIYLQRDFAGDNDDSQFYWGQLLSCMYKDQFRDWGSACLAVMQVRLFADKQATPDEAEKLNAIIAAAVGLAQPE